MDKLMPSYSVFWGEAYHKWGDLKYSLCQGLSARHKGRECFLSLATGK